MIVVLASYYISEWQPHYEIMTCRHRSNAVYSDTDHFRDARSSVLARKRVNSILSIPPHPPSDELSLGLTLSTSRVYAVNQWRLEYGDDSDYWWTCGVGA